MEGYAKLHHLFLEGAKKALTQMKDARPDEPLLGFAFMTSDDLCGVYELGYTQPSDADADLYETGTWKFGETEESLDAANDFLYALHDQTPSEPHETYDAHLKACYDVLVAVVRDLQNQQLIQPETFVTVASNDPCHETERWEEETIEALNNHKHVRGWRRYLLEIQEDHLASLLKDDRYKKCWYDIDTKKRLEESIPKLRAKLDAGGAPPEHG